MSPPSADASIPKRTRTNVKQSKFGCFTCKARRIKCDESKPFCRRCLSSKRPCTGYPRGAPPGRWLDTSLPAGGTSKSCLIGNSSYSKYRYVTLACRVLEQGPRRAKSDSEVAFWTYIVPQSTHSIPSVQAAAAAFGASYEEHLLSVGRPCSVLETLQQYNQALRLVQVDLSELKHGIMPCIVACLLLAFTEVLQNRTEKGHLHLQGAFAVMIAQPKGNSRNNLNEEEISLLFQKLDLQSATYALGRSPDLPSSTSVMPHKVLSISPDRALSGILHSCYHFTSIAHRYRYASQRLIPPELVIEQGRHLGALREWLRCNSLQDSSRPAALGSSEQLLTLRAQSLAAFIYTASIFNPYQTAYDDFALEFREIITSAEALFQNHSEGEIWSNVNSSSLRSFTPEMGIIQPLFFSALKYRHPIWRRRALEVLSKCGREGPWHGTIEAAVASAVVEAEELLVDELRLSVEASKHLAIREPSDIREGRRIHSCWVPGYMDRETDDISSGSRGLSTRMRFAKVQMTRCRNLHEMLSMERRSPCAYPWRERRYWDTWIKLVQIPE